MVEAGLNGYEDKIWFGMWAPGGTPERVVDRIAGDVARVLAAPDMRDRLAGLAFEPLRMTRKQYTQFVEGEIESGARIIRVAGIKPQ